MAKSSMAIRENPKTKARNEINPRDRDALTAESERCDDLSLRGAVAHR